MELNNVVVKWKDAYEVREKLSLEEIKNSYDYEMLTSGFLVEKNERFIAIAQHYDSIRNKFSNVNNIPISLIVSINGKPVSDY